MTTAKTTTQAEIPITIIKAAAIPTKIVTVIDMTLMLVTKASHTMWRKSAVTLAPDLRVATAVAVALQVAAALILDPNIDLDEGEVSPSSDTNPTKQRWVLEMARAKPKTKGKDNKVVGFGLFYKQRPFNYSQKEFLAEQGHRDHIRTADCTDANKAEYDQATNDSGCESD
eukprot:11418379-Ditylum_brightwellii.AAC.1